MNMRKTLLIFHLAVVSMLLLSACYKTGASISPTASSIPSTTAGNAVTVTSPADSGPGTLRSALQAATSGSTILFDPTIFPPEDPVTISLNSKLPPIQSDRLIINASNAGVILDGNSIGKTPEKLLLDDISLTANGGKNLLLNGDFSAGLGHWHPQDQNSGAQRSLDTGDFHSAPASYSWSTVALVAAGNTIYDTTDSSAALKLWTEPWPGSSWLPVKEGDQVELRFWYRYGPIAVQLHASYPDAHTQQLGQWSFERKGDWTEAVVRQTIPAGACSLALDFLFDHSDRFTNGLDIRSNGNKIQGLQIINFPQAGIALSEVNGNLVGGDRRAGKGPLGQTNRLSGNGSFGIGIWGKTSANNTIQGNVIGTDLAGKVVQGGSRDGITVIEAHDNLFEGNLISSYSNGIYICCTDAGRNRILGNFIGTDANGSVGPGNLIAGIVLDRAGHNLVGPGNKIAYNPQGIIITGAGALGNTITQNSIYANPQAGIVLSLPKGVQPPVARLLNFDLATGLADGEACPGCIVEIFSTGDNQGETFEGQVAANSDGKFTFQKGSLFAGPTINITVTDANGSTGGFVGLSTPAMPTATSTYSVELTPQPWIDHVINSLKPANFGRLNTPTAVVVAQDDTLFVADTLNHRILHMDGLGNTSFTWGSLEESKSDAIAATGKFDQPWGLGISPDGFIFVADTWNHRIQKFSLDGKFITTWGRWGKGNDPYQFFGPRGVVVNSSGYVILTDTGNKRLVVYDEDGKFISQLGGEGNQLGQFNEPVGIALDAAGNIYVADTWNKRVQVLTIDAKGNLSAQASWPVNGWDGDSELKKPGIAVSGGHVFVPDPEKYTVLEFDVQGILLRTYDLAQAGRMGKGILTGIAADGTGGLWVSDSANNLIFHLLPGK